MNTRQMNNTLRSLTKATILLLFVVSSLLWSAQALAEEGLPEVFGAPTATPLYPSNEGFKAPEAAHPQGLTPHTSPAFTWQYEVDIPTEKTSVALPAQLVDANLEVSTDEIGNGQSRLKVRGLKGQAEARKFLNQELDHNAGLIRGVAEAAILMPVKALTPVSIRLESNPSTGYQWMAAEGKSDGLPMQVNSSYTARAGYGSPYIQTITLTPLQNGAATIRLVYRRPFEPEASVTRRLMIEMPEQTAELDLSHPAVVLPQSEASEAQSAATDSAYSLAISLTGRDATHSLRRPDRRSDHRGA